MYDNLIKLSLPGNIIGLDLVALPKVEILPIAKYSGFGEKSSKAENSELLSCSIIRGVKMI